MADFCLQRKPCVLTLAFGLKQHHPHMSVLVNLARQLDSSDFNFDSQSVLKLSLNSINDHQLQIKRQKEWDKTSCDKSEEWLIQTALKYHWRRRRKKKGATTSCKQKLTTVTTACWRCLCSPYFGGMIFWMPIFSLQEAEIKLAWGPSGESGRQRGQNLNL